MGLVFVLGLVATPGQALGKGKARKLHTFSSVKPYLEHALQHCGCMHITDEFDQRDCERDCPPFRDRMIAWARKNRLVHQRLRLKVENYDFRNGKYALKYSERPIDRGLSGVAHNHVLIGNEHCWNGYGMLQVSQAFSAAMSEKAARDSVLRGIDEAVAQAVLDGNLTYFDCRTSCPCDGCGYAGDGGARCAMPAFLYGVVEVEVTPKALRKAGIQPKHRTPWRQGFQGRIIPMEFTPKTIGITKVPNFEKPSP
jgi:hypothetical protein